MYPPQALFKDELNDDSPQSSPLPSPKSSPLLPRIDFAEAFARIYRDSPQNSSPPTSLCPSSPQSNKDSLEIQETSIISSGPPDFDPVGSHVRRREGQPRHVKRQSIYHPYIRKTPPTPQAERKMASLMGRVAEDLDHNDESVRKIFSRGLQRMSAEGIRRAAYYKEAELEYHRHLSMTLAWEAEKLSRLKHFLDEEQQLQADKTTEAFEEAALFTRMIVDRDSERASEDLDSVTATHKDEMKKMNELNTELDELDIFLSPNLPAPHNAASDIHINTKDEPAGKLQ